MRFLGTNKKNSLEKSGGFDESTLATLNDAELVEKYRAGAEKAFTILVQRHTGAVYSFVARYVGGGSEAEDIVQDVFVKVWKHLGRFDIQRNFRTWIFTIAKNTALDWLKKKKAITFSELHTHDDTTLFEETLAADEPLPSDVFDTSRSQEELSTALSTLSADYRAVILLRLDSQLTFREIAEALGKPLNTVKSHYRRAVGLLDQQLSRTK